MTSKAPVSMAARAERLRDHQVAVAKAVSAHSAALARLEAVTSRRAEVLVAQDGLVAATNAEVVAAVKVLSCIASGAATWLVGAAFSVERGIDARRDMVASGTGVPAGGDATPLVEPLPPPETLTRTSATTTTTATTIDPIATRWFRLRRASTAACCLAAWRSA